jgi:RNA polymerase sigma-70 factor (ECF subfamily)
MIFDLEQPPTPVSEPRDNGSQAQNTVNGEAQAVNGIRRNYAAPSEPQIIVSREHDHWDMARLANGDEEGLDSLMERHSKNLLRHLERMVRNHSDAKELVNDAFLRVFRHRLDYNYQSKFSTWLYVIGSHLAINLLRWRARRPEQVPLPEAASENSGGSVTLLDSSPTPCEQAEADEWTDALEKALARLPEQLREPLLLVALDGCSQAEVAARLGCTVKAVETRIYHGRRRLRSELENILSPWRSRVDEAIRPSNKQDHSSHVALLVRDTNGSVV